MRKILPALLLMALPFVAAAQCSIIEVPLAQRTASSQVIVEGKVIAKNSYWDTRGTMIYTASTVEVYKVFKGNVTGATIDILTEGGTVGYDMIKVEPSLELNVGDYGMFTCTSVNRVHPNPVRAGSPPQYEPYASIQGFIKYDATQQSGADQFRKYPNVQNDLYPLVGSYTVVKAADQNGQRLNQQVSIESISSFSPTTITAGTGAQLTITGSGFGATQGSGTVGFKNADDGGATYIQPLASQYVSWSNTQIVVEVPSNAGTGTIQVTQGVTTTSAQTLTVSWAHLNVDFDPGPGTIAYQTDHVDDNGSGGYTWQMNPGFASNSAAVAAFDRAFDSWRCYSGINWTIGANTAINDAVSDGTNCICFDNTAPLSAGILGVCYSYWSGCASGPNIVWYVNELDIIFDDGSNISPLTWNFGPGLPTGSQYDFESVAVHELGHGHQLGHVIASGQIMHYALSNGGSNRSLSANDQAAANFVQAKSEAGNICGPGAMTHHTCASAPVANFSGSPTSVCSGNTVAFTDLSTNTPTSWAWTFTGGTPSSSTSQNPTITYNTPGTYDVSLTATNAAGSDAITMTGYITVTSCGSAPVASFSGTPTSICAGGTVSFTDQSTNTPTSWSWTFTGGTPSSSTSQNPTITYNTPGTYDVSLTATNASGSDAVTMTGYITVNANPSASGSSTNAGCSLSNGTATATPSGGTSPYSYSWNPSAQTTQTATALAAGNYTCTVVDANGCSTTTTATVGSTACGPTQLTAASCGSTAASMNSYIYCTPVSGATNYRYNFVNNAMGYSQTFARGTSATNFPLSMATTLQYGVTYSVRVASYVGGTWSSFGPACNVTTPAFPTTSLQAAYCSTTVNSLNDIIYCTAVSGATGYKWRIVDQSNGATQTYIRNGGADMRLVWFTGVQYGKTYDIDVCANVGGVYGPFGSVCSISTPAFPTTQVTATYCGATLAAVSTTIYCNAVPGATNYQWKVENTSLNYSSIKMRNSNATDWSLAWNTGTHINTTYTVSVRAYVGGVWGAYGTACSVTTGPVAITVGDNSVMPAEVRLGNMDDEASSTTITVYPNPFSDQFTISTDGSVSEVGIYNAFGEKVRDLILTDNQTDIFVGDLPAGIYFLRAKTADGQWISQKLVRE